jgi:hypothetical protein
MTIGGKSKAGFPRLETRVNPSNNNLKEGNMETTKHTPWEWRVSGGTKVTVHNCNGRLLATCKDIAIARFFATTPKLLALAHLVDFVATETHQEKHTHADLMAKFKILSRTARVAIAKAIGQE